MKTNSSFLKIIGLLAIACTWAQTSQAQVARFVASMDRYERHADHETAEYKRIMEMEWRIHGQVLHFGADTLSIPVDDKIDTVYYRRDLQSKWDTMICNIDQPKLISFLYNDCCGAFNVSDSSMRRLVQASVEFRIQGNPNGKAYIGMLGEDGALLYQHQPAIVEPICHSAVVPNIFWISLSEIWPCQPADSCEGSVCLMEPGLTEPRYDFTFKHLKKHASFLYLPIYERPLVVTYDVRKRKITVE